MTSDDRFTAELIIDVLGVLERHGHHRYDNRHTGQAVAAIIDLAYVYDGTRDISYGTHAPPAPDAGPESPGPGQDDAVILTDAEVGTVAAALDIAADYHRDRAAACTDCPDQTCVTCRSRHRDAQAYDQMAAQMLQTAQASRAASSAQPEPGSPSGPPRQPQLAADKEAGQ